MPRCFWCNDDPLYIAYHDDEWGVPLRDPQRLFELLLLEGFQAGLSWITVLKKRERYRQVLFGFDAQRLAVLSDEEIEELMQDPGIIRNRLKLKAARENAQAWLRLGRSGRAALVVCRWGGEDQSLCRPQRRASHHGGSRGDEQGAEKGRFHLRRPDHLLCLYAGGRHGHGPHHRL